MSRTPSRRQAGGFHFESIEDAYKALPSFGRMLDQYDARDVALMTYVFDFIQASDRDPRVKTFYSALAENYAQRFAGWLGHVFLNRANRTHKSKMMKDLEEGLGTWVESIPAILEKKAKPEVSHYVPPASRFLNFDIIDAIGRKIVKVVYQEWGAAVAGKMASKQAGLDQLPISYDKGWGKYVIQGDQMTYQYKQELKDLGFSWNPSRKVWFTDALNSDILKALPEAGKLQRGSPPPTIADVAVDTSEWFFESWLPKNLNRFAKVFNDYGRSVGVPYQFKFFIQGRDVTVDFRRDIKTISEAIAELEARYGKQDDREGWMQAIASYWQLQKAHGPSAMHAIDIANNLEHTHGAMMEHFPDGVRSWYPKFLDFKYTAHPLVMIKQMHSGDFRDLANELYPLSRRNPNERLSPPDVAHRTPKGLALEISSQTGSSQKRKKMEEVKEMYPKLWPQVAELLGTMPMPKGKKPLVGSAVERLAAMYLHRMAAVTVDTSSYAYNHGTEPKGYGQWWFTMGMHPLKDHGNANAWTPGTSLNFAQAKKLALIEARKRGVHIVYVAP